VGQVLEKQLRAGLNGVGKMDFTEVIVAYEPIWAIGTGRNASPQQAEEAHLFVRSILTELADQPTADRMRIIYGGSVKPENAEELMRQKNIDGALIGGASLDPRSFAEIIRSAEAALV
jgi:triosephosphate isomerase